MAGLSEEENPGEGVRVRLREALRAALKSRDMVAASALRSVLSAIGNAEAVDTSVAAAAGVAPVPVGGNQFFAGAVTGLGAGEVARQALSAADVDRIVADEVSEREHAARTYEERGHLDRAERLRAEARAITSALARPRLPDQPC
ncbi:MAG TPA: hypothetical protein VGS19_07110 [Streptosporangiaceae bacterium]|nr:hypothetical protein [Streptosporangiaceae bacterium]